MVVPSRSENRSNSRLTNFATYSLTVSVNQIIKGVDVVGTHQMIEFLTRIGEVFAEMIFNFYPRFLHLRLEYICDEGNATAATRTSFCTFFKCTNICDIA